MSGKGGLIWALGGAALFAALLIVLWPRFQTAPSETGSAAVGFRSEIQPILAKHCYSCHDSKKAKAKLNLEIFVDDASILKARKTWKKIYDQVNAREMPPEDKPRIPAPELEKLTTWIESALDRPDPHAPRDPGRVVIRRLNRIEYRNTIRDLVGVDFNPNAEDFPSDDVGYGFDNIGDVLSMPPVLMEKYLAAAEKILDQAIQTADKHKPKVRHFEARKMDIVGGSAPEGDVLVMFGNGDCAQSVDIKEAGKYLIRIRAAGDQAGPDPVRMSLKVDEKAIKVIDVSVGRKEAKVYEEKVDLRAGVRKITTS